jgi:hypothetical protein
MPPTDRLLTEKNIWLATVRPDGRPHLVPIWFVWLDEKLFISTALESVKAQNLLANPRASAALEDGNQPAIAECTSRLVEAPYPRSVVEAFFKKYEWDIEKDTVYNDLFELTPVKWLSWQTS